jgi:ADP-ribosyl-[dinitrogen reductase] hydrolase
MSLLQKTIASLSNSIAPVTSGAIGDAYGFCFEFATPDHVSKYNRLYYVQHPEFSHVAPGSYSDDTQMQIALAELLASGVDWTPLTIADAFVRVFKRDPRPGYAKRFSNLLTKVQNGRELLDHLHPNSERNGAAMRAPVIGMLPEIQTVIKYATLQAQITHDTPSAIASAVAAALMSHYFVYKTGPKDELPEFLTTHLPSYDWSSPWRDPVPVHGISTVRAALTAIMQSDSLSQLLTSCVAFNGDVDSVATIALSCASSHREFVRDIPIQLWQGLESTKYGIEYLAQLDNSVCRVTINKSS